LWRRAADRSYNRRKQSWQAQRKAQKSKENQHVDDITLIARASSDCGIATEIQNRAGRGCVHLHRAPRCAQQRASGAKSCGATASAFGLSKAKFSIHRDRANQLQTPDKKQADNADKKTKIITPFQIGFAAKNRQYARSAQKTPMPVSARRFSISGEVCRTGWENLCVWISV